jgi:hypothetical protein
LVAVVRGGGTPLYDWPEGSELSQLATGTALTAWGRSADEQWLVVTATSGGAGWVRTSGVVVFNVTALPAVDATGGDAMAAPATPAAPVEEAPVAPPAVTAAVTVASTPVEDEPVEDETITAAVAVTDARLNIRSGPGTGFSILAKADPGAVFEVTGRNAAATWIEVAAPESGDGYGWVAAEFVTLSRPLLSIPASPRAQAVPAATPTPAAVAVSTGLSGRLVFQGVAGGTIYVYDLATGALRALTGGADPSVSPDGRTVAFVRGGGEQGIYLIDIDGRNERRIYSGGEGMRAPAWSPDGRWITFVRVMGEYRCRDIGFGICLPNNPFLNDFPLDQRPDFALSLVDVDGGNFRDLAALNSAQAPNWHTDGIVYQVSTGLEITSDSPTATTRALLQAPYYQDPAWQPGSDRILFHSREGTHWQIFTVRADGSGLAALTRPVTTLVDALPSSVAPAWSPDGQWIVYLSNRDEENSAGAWRLWVMDADGGSQRPLPIDVPLEYGFFSEQVVSWGRAD